MTLKSDAKIEGKMTCGFKNGMTVKQSKQR